jgi:2-(3-amino-3-carboxypropyl)histidine synthase
MPEYDLEIKKAVDEIKKNNAKLVCIQLPDGLKPKAEEIQKRLEAETNADIVIWQGSCFGACDIPVQIDRLGFDMILHWGHPVFLK